MHRDVMTHLRLIFWRKDEKNVYIYAIHTHTHCMFYEAIQEQDHLTFKRCKLHTNNNNNGKGNGNSNDNITTV